MALTTYTNTVNQKPSVLDAILIQGSTATPFLKWFGRGQKISAPKHSWILDKYRKAEDNANLEITDINENTTDTKYMKSNVVQIIKNEFGLSLEDNDSAKYGEKEWAYRVAKVGKEHLLDIEYALLGLGNDSVEDTYTEPTDSDPARMAGIFHYISGTDYSDSNGNPTALTYDRLNEMLEKVWENVDLEDDSFTLVCSPALKRTINSFAGDYFRWQQNPDGKFDPTLYVITTDFGDIKVKLHRLFSNSKLSDRILIGQLDGADIRFKIPTNFSQPPTSKTAKFGRYYSSLTLEVKEPDLFTFGKGLK